MYFQTSFLVGSRMGFSMRSQTGFSTRDIIKNVLSVFNYRILYKITSIESYEEYHIGFCVLHKAHLTQSYVYCIFINLFILISSKSQGRQVVRNTPHRANFLTY